MSLRLTRFPFAILRFANPGPCLAAERSQAINLSNDLRKQLEEAQDAERESRRQMEELQRRLDAMTLEKEATLGRVHGVVDTLSRT